MVAPGAGAFAPQLPDAAVADSPLTNLELDNVAATSPTAVHKRPFSIKKVGSY